MESISFDQILQKKFNKEIFQKNIDIQICWNLLLKNII